MTLQPIASTTMASAIGVLAARAAGAIARGMNAFTASSSARRHDSTNQRPVMSSQAPLLLLAAAGVQPHSIYSYHPTVTTAATMLRRTKLSVAARSLALLKYIPAILVVRPARHSSEQEPSPPPSSSLSPPCPASQRERHECPSSPASTSMGLRPRHTEQEARRRTVSAPVAEWSHTT